MTKSEYRDYLASPEWQIRRKEFLSIYGFDCSKCHIPRWLAAIFYDQDINVHHLSYKNLGREPDEDLMALCRRCHELETFGKSSLRPPWNSPCTTCDGVSYDPYGTGECIECLGLICTDSRIRTYWKGILSSMVSQLGVDAILEEMVDIELENAEFAELFSGEAKR